MGFSSIRQFLSHSAENIGFKVLENEEFVNNINQSLDESGKWHQRERRLTAPFMMRFMFALMLFRSLSIVNVLKMFLQHLRALRPFLPLSAVTPEAACHARERLGVEPMRLFFERQAREVEPYSLFHGMQVWGVDGTRFNIPDTAANESFFGRPKASRGETAYPQMGAVCLVETSTRQVGAAVFTPYDIGERVGVEKMLNRLAVNDILLMDRGISAGWLFYELQKRSLHFIGKISSTWQPDIIKRFGGGDFLVSVKVNAPSKLKKERKLPKALTLRMIRYQIGENENVRLLTNLVDTEKYPPLELAKLYHSRWECELAYDELKNHLTSRASGVQDLLFRSKKPDGVLQEAYALVGLYNTIRGIMAESGKIHKIEPADISFVETVQIIKDTMPRYQAAKNDNQRLTILAQMLKDIAETKNQRPRRKRQYPRVVKKKMSSYKLKRKDCVQKLMDAQKEMKLI